jgi:hypothetical protein
VADQIKKAECAQCGLMYPESELIPVIIRGMQSFSGHVIVGRAAGGESENHVKVCATCRQNLASVPSGEATIEDDLDAMQPPSTP